MSRYKTLRTWSVALVAIGILSITMAIVGTISWVVAVDGFWEKLGVIMFGAPVALLVASWPIAMSQAFQALADVGDSVTFDPTTALPQSSRTA
jgi:hypothetical protein